MRRVFPHAAPSARRRLWFELSCDLSLGILTKQRLGLRVPGDVGALLNPVVFNLTLEVMLFQWCSSAAWGESFLRWAEVLSARLRFAV